ncbi:MAG: hypothetical protein KAT77_06050 [Nanoarchaeota archaeon]|nr:hypothetical protein [Nanoarchaeota archaeon]
MESNKSKSKEFEFFRPEYSDWYITNIVPHNEKPPVLLVRDGEEVESHDFTLPFLIERLGIDERYFVADPEKNELNERDRVYHCKRMYTAQLILKQLRDKDFILSDRVFKRRNWQTYEGAYGFPNVCATTTIGRNGNFLSYGWINQLGIVLGDGVAEIKEYSGLNFHDLKRDLVHQQNREWEGEGDPTGQKYLGCLESAIELCKRTEEVPSLALILLHRGVSNTLSGHDWKPAIFKELSLDRTYDLPRVNISLDIERIQEAKEAYSRLSSVDSTLREMMKNVISKSSGSVTLFS